MSNSIRSLACLVAASGLALTASRSTFRAAPQGQTRAFLIVQSDLGIHYGAFEEDCPQGFEMTVEEGFLAIQTPAERERLLRPENAAEYAGKWKGEYVSGPGGENICNNQKSFMNDPRHVPYRGVQSKVAYGLNLEGPPDGRRTATTCAHQKFTGVDGEPGIDNQLYRAIGCTKYYRGSGPRPQVRVDPFVIEIRGIDDPKNDEHVDVSIFSTDDAPLKGAGGNALPHQTLAVTRNPQWRAAVAGRIVDGQITTDVAEAVHLHQAMPSWDVLGTDFAFEFHRARFRLSVQTDGTLTGVMAAYRPIENIFTSTRCCKAHATTSNVNCASEHKTLAMLADGFPDPETGQCTMISSASNIQGIPVFTVAAREERSSNVHLGASR